MQATHVGEIAGGIVLVEDYVGNQPGAPVDALEQIVAEQRVLRHSALQAALKGSHVVDALADVDPLAEKVLIDVGYRTGVEIQPGVSSEKSREERLVRLSGPDLRPRLKYGVSGDHLAAWEVKLGLVQRVSQGADEAARAAPGQNGIGIQCNDVLDLRENVGLAQLHAVRGLLAPLQ